MIRFSKWDNKIKVVFFFSGLQAVIVYIRYSNFLVMHLIKQKVQNQNKFGDFFSMNCISFSLKRYVKQNKEYCEIRNFRAVQFSRKCDFGKFARSQIRAIAILGNNKKT